MNRRITIVILTCLVGLWSAAAQAQEKIKPPPAPAIQIKPIEPVVPPPKLPPVPLPAAPTPVPAIEPVVPQPQPTPTALPAAPMVSPVIEPIVPPPKLPPVPLPAEPVKPPPVSDPARFVPPPPPPPPPPLGGNLGERLRELEEAGLLPGLGEQPTAVGEAMRPDTPDDPLMGGAGIQTDANDPFADFCKRPGNQQFLMCAGRRGGGLSPDGEIGSGYNTERPFKPAPTPFDGPTAGSRVPDRRDRFSDDDSKTERETFPDGRIHEITTYPDGRREEFRVSGDGQFASKEVYRSDGTRSHTVLTEIVPDRGPGARRGDYVVYTTYRTGRGTSWDTTQRCRADGRCTPDRQPDERGPQGKARAWFCARNPEAKECQPSKAEDYKDPAHPDAAGRPRAETPRLGREAVVNPGPGDHILGTPSGGGGGPMYDPKDPINPDRPR